MSNAPYLLKGARWGYRLGHAEAIDSMLAEGLTCAINSLPHGDHRRGSRRALRHLACGSGCLRAESQRRAARAIGDGSFAAEIVAGRSSAEEGRPRLIVDTDEYPRAGHDASRSSAALKPAFRKDGSVTAGNASGINDGAAALVVAIGRDAREPRALRRWRGSLAYATDRRRSR